MKCVEIHEKRSVPGELLYILLATSLLQSNINNAIFAEKIMELSQHLFHAFLFQILQGECRDYPIERIISKIQFSYIFSVKFMVMNNFSGNFKHPVRSV